MLCCPPPCLCIEGQSCPKCSGPQPVTSQTPCDYTTFEQQLRDIEVRLKNDNKALRLQIVALEEQVFRLEGEILRMKQATLGYN